ncbi:MAG: DUF2911 domain-containing protein [Chitinophagaceae bacterium]|nr:DUF2911 domain-containing protein [Chitinophagaceae bacterium]
MKFFPLCGLLLFLSCKEANDKPASPSTASQKNDSSLLKSEVSNPYAPIDISPMDMSYFPPDFPLQKMSKKTDDMPVVRVIYSRPHLGNRKMFGGWLKYGEPWRLGANEATEIEFFREVTIQNKKIRKGRYVLYCIPQPNNWSIIFNSNTFSWGLRPDPQKNLFQFTIPVTHAGSKLEFFTMVFQKSSTGADLVMAWEDVVARLPISF